MQRPEGNVFAPLSDEEAAAIVEAAAAKVDSPDLGVMEEAAARAAATLDASGKGLDGPPATSADAVQAMASKFEALLEKQAQASLAAMKAQGEAHAKAMEEALAARGHDDKGHEDKHDEGTRSEYSDVSESEGEGTRAALPVRKVAADDRTKRPQGGRDRLPLRKAALHRVHAQDMTAAEMGRVERTLESALKVPPPTLHTRARQGQRAGRPASLSEAMLVEMVDIAPKSESERMVASMMSVFRDKASKEVKTVKHYSSFQAWYKKYSEEGFFSQELFDQDPHTFWCWDWHLKCMLFVMGEYDWAAAMAYHKRVLRRWHRLPLDELVYSEDCREGDWEAALHSDSLYATQFKASKSGAKPPRVKSTEDYHCKPCGKYFKRADNHQAVCPKKKAPAAAAAGAAPPRT